MTAGQTQQQKDRVIAAWQRTVSRTLRRRYAKCGRELMLKADVRAIVDAYIAEQLRHGAKREDITLTLIEFNRLIEEQRLEDETQDIADGPGES